MLSPVSKKEKESEEQEDRIVSIVMVSLKSVFLKAPMSTLIFCPCRSSPLSGVIELVHTTRRLPWE